MRRAVHLSLFLFSSQHHFTDEHIRLRVHLPSSPALFATQKLVISPFPFSPLLEIASPSTEASFCRS